MATNLALSIAICALCGLASCTVHSEPTPDSPRANAGSAAAPSMNAPSTTPIVGNTSAPQTGEPCTASGQTRVCWTGPEASRNIGRCHDGKQTCSAQGQEFSAWGPCEGEETNCGAADAGVPSECGCVPGKMVSCDEDCSAQIFCSLTGVKTCLPDGTWGPCRETSTGIRIDVGGLINDLNVNEAFCASIRSISLQPIAAPSLPGSVSPGCRNIYFGCCPSAREGAFMGDCAEYFSCKHPPIYPQ